MPEYADLVRTKDAVDCSRYDPSSRKNVPITIPAGTVGALLQECSPTCGEWYISFFGHGVRNLRLDLVEFLGEKLV